MSELPIAQKLKMIESHEQVIAFFAAYCIPETVNYFRLQRKKMNGGSQRGADAQDAVRLLEKDGNILFRLELFPVK